MTLKARITQLEKRRRPQRLTWKELIDADGIAALMERDPNFAAAWNEFTGDQKPSEILEAIRQANHEQP